MTEVAEREDFEDAFDGLEDLIAATEASPEYAEESLVGDAQSLIVAAMAEQKINRVQLAARMSVSKARVSQMLSPACTNLTVRLLGRAGHALNLNLKLVRADDVVARKHPSGTWCIGSPWAEPDWEAARINLRDQAANDHRKADLSQAAAILRRTVVAEAA